MASCVQSRRETTRTGSFLQGCPPAPMPCARACAPEPRDASIYEVTTGYKIRAATKGTPTCGTRRREAAQQARWPRESPVEKDQVTRWKLAGRRAVMALWVTARPGQLGGCLSEELRTPARSPVGCHRKHDQGIGGCSEPSPAGAPASGRCSRNRYRFPSASRRGAGGCPRRAQAACWQVWGASGVPRTWEGGGRPSTATGCPCSARAHRRFCELLPQERRGVEESLQARVPLEQVLGLPELKANPFKERICRVFSTAPARDSLSFEDFLDLLSVFSDTATPDIKSHYAFRIFDFDDDGTLNREDLSQLVNCLTGEGEDTQLSPLEMKQLVDNILEESDIDRDGTINLSEFQHVISRSPDFASSFKIVL
ncbi:PREDICTED: calcium and integrin-binding protein 1 [Condylura cristata]|uniref:calcium and integrin-binding protein 1 n=1 Tax=Condylura cristata TaxID=143302 RepID=UPI000642DD25|nr:PREDICTED: calcium and integrin-binding protein 1 [Condylura cristata]